MKLRTAILLLCTALAACSSPAKDPVDAGADDVATSDDASGTPDAGDDSSDADFPEFEFGFEPVPFLGTLTGVHGASVMWEGEPRPARFFIFEGTTTLGTLSFDVDASTYSYRFEAVFGLFGEVSLSLTERSCSENGAACDDDVPATLRESLVYDAIGRHNGAEVIFAPLTVRPGARELAPEFAFAPPLDPRMTPNDGFKPAEVPDPAATWDGPVSLIPAGLALSGERPCRVVIEQPDLAYELISLACDGTTYALGANPGPDPDSLEVDETQLIVTFDFVDGDERWTFAGYVDVGTFSGVIVEASRYDQLDSPSAATVTDVDGLFFFESSLF